MADVPVPGFRKYWTQKLASLNSQCHAIINKYPEAGSVVQVHKVLNEIEILAGCTPAKVGENPEWTTIVNSTEENRSNFCKSLDGKPISSALYFMYTVTLNELKVVSAQAKHSGAANKTSSEPTAQDDEYREAKRRMRHNSNDNSQSAKMSTKTIPTSASVKLPPRAASTRNYFAPLRTTDMDMETTGSENMLPEQEAPRKSGRPPPIVMTSTTNLIRLQRDLKEHVKGEYEF
jgi:hypothetical protein